MWAALAAILLAGCAVRLWGLGAMPHGLNQDEASEFYEAYSLLHYGMDRNGVHNPVQFISWGSGQNVGYAWLCMPFFALLGPTNFAGRLPMALVGCLSIWVMYCLAKQWFGRGKALVFAAVLALAPWHIMKSRWALESNLLPDVLLLGVCLLVYYLYRQRLPWLIGAMAAFAFACYCYGTSYFVLPLFLLPAAVIMLVKKQGKPTHLAIGAGVFGVLALPMILFVLVNNFDLPAITTPLFSIPKLYENRSELMFSLLNGGFAETIRGGWEGLKNLVLTGADISGSNLQLMRGFGVCYLVTFPFFLVGIAASFRRPAKGEYLMQLWLGIGLLLAFLAEFNANRINALWVPVIYFTARGLALLPRRWCQGACGVLAALFLLFCVRYFGPEHQAAMNYEMADGYQQCLDAVAEDEGDIYITGEINMPYIYVLLHERYDPNEYLATRHIATEGIGFESVMDVGRWHFYLPDEFVEGSVFITTAAQADAYPDEAYTKETHGMYRVIREK